MSPLWLLFSYHVVHFMLYFKLACLAYCYFSVKLACLVIFLMLKCFVLISYHMQQMLLILLSFMATLAATFLVAAQYF
jgi:hypothetical protein